MGEEGEEEEEEGKREERKPGRNSRAVREFLGPVMAAEFLPCWLCLPCLLFSLELARAACTPVHAALAVAFLQGSG